MIKIRLAIIRRRQIRLLGGDLQMGDKRRRIRQWGFGS